MNTDVENVRTEFDPMIVPSGHVVHLVDWSFDWGHVVCGRSASAMRATTADDPRPTCRLCSGPAAIARAIDVRKLHAERKVQSFDSLDSTMEKIDAMIESIKEQQRRRRILRGLPPERPVETVDEIRAKTIAMRAENDQLAAEQSGAWQTYD